jgi:hypothetical protein
MHTAMHCNAHSHAPSPSLPTSQRSSRGAGSVRQSTTQGVPATHSVQCTGWPGAASAHWLIRHTPYKQQTLRHVFAPINEHRRGQCTAKHPAHESHQPVQHLGRRHRSGSQHTGVPAAQVCPVSKLARCSLCWLACCIRCWYCRPVYAQTNWAVKHISRLSAQTHMKHVWQAWLHRTPCTGHFPTCPLHIPRSNKGVAGVQWGACVGQHQAALLHQTKVGVSSTAQQMKYTHCMAAVRACSNPPKTQRGALHPYPDQTCVAGVQWGPA